MLIKSGQGPFLHPHRLKEKLHLQMTKYGLHQSDPEVYGLLTDMTEQLMRDIVSNLIHQSRARR